MTGKHIWKINKYYCKNFQELSNNPILFSILDQSLRGNNIKSQASKIYTKCIRTNGPWITINKNFKKGGREKIPHKCNTQESDMKKGPSSRLLQGLSWVQIWRKCRVQIEYYTVVIRFDLGVHLFFSPRLCS